MVERHAAYEKDWLIIEFKFLSACLFLVLNNINLDALNIFSQIFHRFEFLTLFLTTFIEVMCHFLAEKKLLFYYAFVYYYFLYVHILHPYQVDRCLGKLETLLLNLISRSDLFILTVGHMEIS